MPAREGDVTLGISQVIIPERANAYVEVRVEPDEVEHSARIGATAILTAIFGEGDKGLRVVKLPVTFTRGGPSALRFSIVNGEIKPVSR